MKRIAVIVASVVLDCILMQSSSTLDRLDFNIYQDMNDVAVMSDMLLTSDDKTPVECGKIVDRYTKLQDKLMEDTECRKQLARYKVGANVYRAVHDNADTLGSVDIVKVPVASLYSVVYPYGKALNPNDLKTDVDNKCVGIMCPYGASVLAQFNGTISEVGETDELGKYIILKCSGDIVITYTHLLSTNVSAGDTVSQYDCIGEVGYDKGSKFPIFYLRMDIDGKNCNPILC